jgi:hypothetical protein
MNNIGVVRSQIAFGFQLAAHHSGEITERLGLRMTEAK